jgi:hypothetical protein
MGIKIGFVGVGQFANVFFAFVQASPGRSMASMSPTSSRIGPPARSTLLLPSGCLCPAAPGGRRLWADFLRRRRLRA